MAVTLLISPGLHAVLVLAFKKCKDVSRSLDIAAEPSFNEFTAYARKAVRPTVRRNSLEIRVPALG